ncbi:MAG: efflux RND transporter periplasmic adaptor subunit [Desulfomonile tiedjei]|nr:efflux RND transporter periplasmic adaptor subunit [Desulfomonile tiedjei]
MIDAYHMKSTARIVLAIACFAAAAVPVGDSYAAGITGKERPVAALTKQAPSGPREQVADPSVTVPIKSAVIVPFRAADVPADARGIITVFNFEKGDLVQKGQPIVEISKDRYEIMVEMAKTKLDGLKQSLKFAEESLASKKEIYSKHYGTRQKLLEAEAELSTIRHKAEEAKRELQLAKINLQSCVVRAPFTGYLVEKYKEAHEAVNQLDKLFRIVDTHNVYGVANVPENQLERFRKGARASFVDSLGTTYAGSVDKIEPVICPESKTAKVHLLIQNPQFALKVGMTGALWSE